MFAGYKVLMPALKGKRKQLTTVESNESRFVTKVRWVIEAIHGILGEKCHLLHHQVDNKLLPKIKSYCQVASFFNNKFGKRLDLDAGLVDEILGQIHANNCTENSLEQEIEVNGWERRKVPFKFVCFSDVADFPEMSERDLTFFFTGPYQMSQAVSYLAEIMDSDNNIKMSCVKEKENILKV